MDRTFVAIDVETTGLEAGTDEIIEVAAVKFTGDTVLETFQKLIKPHHSLPLKIARLTNISDEMLADAPRFSQVAPELVRFVKSYPLVGHSVGFDLKMLQAQGMRLPQPAYDTFDMATLLMPRAPAYRLGALAAAIGITHEEAHRALADAHATRQVFLYLLKRIEALELHELSEINRLTAKLEWSLRDLFGEVERAKAKNVFVEIDDRRPTTDDASPAEMFEISNSKLKTQNSELVPLKPTGNNRPLDIEAIRRFFSPEGAMGRAFEGYEQREPQVEMAEAVTRAFDNGEAVMIEAGTGTGKCVSGDTWITFRSGRRAQIREVCQASYLPAEPILCVTSSGKLTYQPIRIASSNGVRPVWKLRTALGRAITATANHPFLTVEGWQQLHDLKVGDRVAVIRSLPAGVETELFNASYVVGAMLGDGGCTHADVLMFTNFDREIVARVGQEVAELGNVEMVATARKGRYRFRRLRLLKHERSGLNILLEKLNILGKGAHQKDIPSPYFQADTETISRLLAGLWDTDGSIESRDGHPSYASVSEKMIHEIQHLLLRLNIIARLRYKIARFDGRQFSSWNLTISDLESKHAFWQTVGKHMVGEKKRRLEEWWEAHPEQRYNTNDDLLPISVWNVINEERQMIGKSWYAIRKKCIVASDRSREISRAKMHAIGQYLASPKLVELAVSDLYWDQITSIEPAGELETFDLTMDGEPNFVANDIVVHNSIAYLVPAALFAAQRGERVVISTNTINLQDQLFFKDIPALQRLMGNSDQGLGTGKKKSSAPNPQSPIPNPQLPFTAALLKGRSNYLCLRRYKDLRRDGRLVSEEIKTLLKVQLWLPTTTSGDKAELLLVDKENMAWERINATLETCTGPRCADYRDCYLYKARREAEAAHLVIVNHALLLANLDQEVTVFPPYDHVIIDEAHNLEEVATDQFGFEVDQTELLKFLDDLFMTGGVNTSAGLFAELPKHFRESAATESDMEKATAIAQAAGPAVTRGRQSVYDCFNLLTAFMNAEAESTSYDARLRVTDAVRKNSGWEAIERAWENLSLNLDAIGEALGRLEVLLTDLKDADLLEYDMLLLRVQSLKRYVTKVRINIGYIVLGGEQQLITWLVYDRAKDKLTLSAAPLSVAELLEATLFSQKATVALASATLAVGGEFGYVKERIGLVEPEELQLESPFDYQKQALVYIPNDMPEPNQRGYQQALEETLIALCTATGGRALVLFTANSALRMTYKAIQEPLEDQGIAVLGQGLDGSRRALLERFKEFPRTVLLGTTSFWEGVDVVGDALSVLVIAKLPFSVPNDPIFAARSEGFADAFNEYAVPQAILRFKQGFGRLIRSREDRGVVAVLDRRLLSKKYGQVFLDSLPHTTVRSGPAKQLPLLAARFLV